jgi:integrase
VRHLHPHQTRHSFAMNYARRPLNISPLEHRIRLRDLLGHKSLESADPYFEPSQEDVLGYWEELAAEEELLTEEEAPARPEPAAKSNPPDSDPFRDIKRHLGLSR